MDELVQIKQEIGEVVNEKLEAKLIEKQLAQEKAKEKIEIKLSENRKKISDLNDTQQENKAKAELKQSIINILKKMQEEGKISECPTCGREMDEKLAQKIVQKTEEEIKFFQKQIDDLIIKINDLNVLYQKTDREKQQYDRIISELQLKKNGLREILQELNSNESMIKQFKSKGYPLTLEEIEKQLDKFDEEEKKLNQAIGVAKGAELVKKQNIQDLLKEEEGYKHKQKISELIIDAMVKATKKLREDFMARVKNQVEDIWKTYKGEKWTIDCDENFVPYAKQGTALRTL